MIHFFKDKYRFLSNFWPAVVRLEGVDYPTVEHAYQAAKTLDHRQRITVLNQSTPGRAKRMGKLITLRDDWDEVKIHTMTDLIAQKFDHPYLEKKLLATGTTQLIEGNYWHDLYWGKCYCGKHRAEGRNELGQILMMVREHLEERK